jgi:hypothetical protein
MSIVLLGCDFGFYAFNPGGAQILSGQKYRTARLDDHDFCTPNGFLTLEYGMSPCGLTVTESTGDYAVSFPVGNVMSSNPVYQMEYVVSPTFSYFFSGCPDPNNPTNPIKLSWTLSNPI